MVGNLEHSNQTSIKCSYCRLKQQTEIKQKYTYKLLKIKEDYRNKTNITMMILTQLQKIPDIDKQYREGQGAPSPQQLRATDRA
jgi:hypothetical protein